MSGTVERNMSVDDLVGGMWRMGAAAGVGFKRTDSEAAFQEFLKRIPSSTNITQGGIDASLGQHLVDGCIPGMPRVPSVDFLRQLANAQSQMGGVSPVMQGARVNVEGPATKLTSSHNPAALKLDANALSSALQSLPADKLEVAPHGLAATKAVLGTSHGHSGGHGSGAQSAQTSAPSSQVDFDQDDDREDNRRARRMLSNRESARRSRRRKQEHLGHLEGQIAALQAEKKTAHDLLASVARRVASMEDDNRRMQQENERLRDELQFLRSELKARHRRHRSRSDSESDASDHEAAAKRHHSNMT
uniref:BZIP domain-containing protein n=1 Tax=Chlamydomonas euryale TaxID=1486919 RepID=A0A7R9YTH8_9CHLO|mmetsp:Transcript_20540/g.61244  ORF Transcript_20540/g.61244 Transcript_20540/m.61244 type:complete len:304 (+) Transcript_20540:396-1307(+)